MFLCNNLLSTYFICQALHLNMYYIEEKETKILEIRYITSHRKCKMVITKRKKKRYYEKRSKTKVSYILTVYKLL